MPLADIAPVSSVTQSHSSDSSSTSPTSVVSSTTTTKLLVKFDAEPLTDLNSSGAEEKKNSGEETDPDEDNDKWIKVG